MSHSLHLMSGYYSRQCPFVLAASCVDCSVQRHSCTDVCDLLPPSSDVALLSQILGNNECFEPYTSNIYVRRVLSGEFTVRCFSYRPELIGCVDMCQWLFLCCSSCCSGH